MAHSHPFPAIPAAPARRAAAAILATVLLACAAPVLAAGHSLRFFGTGSGDLDRVKIRVDDPLTSMPGPPADIGAGDFTLEFWLKATAPENTAAAVTCGANIAWINGNIVVDRDRFGLDRKYGVSIAGGKVVYGVSGSGTGDLTLCSLSSVLDGAWHHVAVQRRASDGNLWLFVDGNLEAQAVGPGGDISYPDSAAPAAPNDPFLVLGAEKHDAGSSFPSFSGWLDELRISSRLRYASNFSRPRAPFLPDRYTAALYHFDEGNGATLYDTAGATGGPSNGQIKNGPAWAPDSPFNVGGIVNNGTIALSPFVAGFTRPVDIVNAGDGSGRLYVVQQGDGTQPRAQIRIIRNGALLPTPFLDISAKVICCGELGLLGLAFHPNYNLNGRFFVFYTRLSDGALTIERYQRSADNTNVADTTPANVKTLLVIPHPGQSNHNGGKLAFGRDGYLYIGTGDGGSGNDPPNNAQTLGVRLGKLLRIDVDQNVNTPPYYGIPPTNPFAAGACNGAGSGTCPEIWAYGLRNPWRWTFDRVTGDLFIGDVGQGAHEEVDFDPWPGTPGRNYGWRIMEGNICTPGFPTPCMPPPNYAPPIFDVPHPTGIAIVGGYRYRGNAIPALAGAYVYGDEGSNFAWAATRANSGVWTAQQQLLVPPANISAFGEDEAGELYAAGYTNGTIYRLVPRNTDADGLPDWWEMAYFGNATSASPAADADGDGADNLAEYQYGTDPLNAQSVPTSPPVLPGAAVFRPSMQRFYMDFDSDRRADQIVNFGALGSAPNDVPLVGRVDNDRRYDPVLYRNGLWYSDINRDGAADSIFGFGGVTDDQPLLADFNGDGRDDLVIYRNGVWFVSTAQNGIASLVYYFGGAGVDVALAGDVNGDGIVDLVIYRNGLWFIDTNRDGLVDIIVGFGGVSGDKPVLFDWDGDGRADLCVVRNGIWYVNTQLNGTAQAAFGYGNGADTPFGFRE